MTNSNSARRKTCTKKKSYKTPFDAILAAMDYSKKFLLDYHPYECPFCKLIHLSTKSEFYPPKEPK